MKKYCAILVIQNCTTNFTTRSEMKYTDNNCPVCGKTFSGTDDIVVCPECGTPHHRECWTENGHCANRHKHTGGFVWKSSVPEIGSDEKKEEEKPKGKVCPECGLMCHPRTKICKGCGYEFDDRDTEADSSPYDFSMGPVKVHRVKIDDVKIDGVPADEISEYIGSSAPLYLSHFVKMDAKKTKLSWNFAAALFGPLWAVFRGLYKLGILLAVLLLVGSCVSTTKADILYYDKVIDLSKSLAQEEITQEEFLNQINTFAAEAAEKEEKPGYAVTVIRYSIQAFIVVFAGLMGNYCFRKKMIPEIIASRSEANDMQTYKAILRKKGRGKIFPAVLVILFDMAVPAISYLIMKSVLF